MVVLVAKSLTAKSPRDERRHPKTVPTSERHLAFLWNVVGGKASRGIQRQRTQKRDTLTESEKAKINLGDVAGNVAL